MLLTTSRYEVVRSLGRGSLAKSYTAVEIGAHGVARPVTLKILEGDEVSPLRKATLRALATGHHHGILLPRAMLVDGVGVAVVYDHLIAHSLVSLIARCLGDASPMDEGLATTLFARAAESLADLHEGRLGKATEAHGAIRPSNILVSHVGGVWIDDTGLAANACELFARQSLSTAHAQFASSAALEAAASGSEVLSTQVAQDNDVYGLVSCLYSVVTAQWPHEADDLEQLMALKADGPPAPPRQHNGRLSLGLDALLSRTLSPKGQRPSARRIADGLCRIARTTANDIGGQLRKLLDDLPTPDQRALLKICESPDAAAERSVSATANVTVEKHAVLEAQQTFAGEIATAISFNDATTHVEMVEPIGLERVLSGTGVVSTSANTTFSDAIPTVASGAKLAAAKLADERAAADFTDDPTEVQSMPPSPAASSRDDDPITLVTPIEDRPKDE